MGNAYADLESEGLIQGTVGRGTFVTPLGETLRAPRGRAHRPSQDHFWDSFFPEEPRDNSLGRLMASSAEEGVISFAAAHGAEELTSPDLVRRAADAVLRRGGGAPEVQVPVLPGVPAPSRLIFANSPAAGWHSRVELDRDSCGPTVAQQSLDLRRRALVSGGGESVGV